MANKLKTIYWNPKGFKEIDGFFGTQEDWNQTLVAKVNELSAQIHAATIRGGATWIACSGESLAIFESLEYFHINAGPKGEDSNLDLERIGFLGSRYTVYKDPYMSARIIRLGNGKKTLGKISFDKISVEAIEDVFSLLPYFTIPVKE